MYVLEIRFCDKQTGVVELRGTDQNARDAWAEFADKLLLGQELGVTAPQAGGHPVQVSLVHFSQLDPNDPGTLHYSVYRTCADLHEAKGPEPKLRALALSPCGRASDHMTQSEITCRSTSRTRAGADGAGWRRCRRASSRSRSR